MITKYLFSFGKIDSSIHAAANLGKLPNGYGVFTDMDMLGVGNFQF